jgi:hypothetical protein
MIPKKRSTISASSLPELRRYYLVCNAESEWSADPEKDELHQSGQDSGFRLNILAKEANLRLEGSLKSKITRVFSRSLHHARFMMRVHSLLVNTFIISCITEDHFRGTSEYLAALCEWTHI